MKKILLSFLVISMLASCRKENETARGSVGIAFTNLLPVNNFDLLAHVQVLDTIRLTSMNEKKTVMVYRTARPRQTLEQVLIDMDGDGFRPVPFNYTTAILSDTTRSKLLPFTPLLSIHAVDIVNGRCPVLEAYQLNNILLRLGTGNANAEISSGRTVWYLVEKK